MSNNKTEISKNILFHHKRAQEVCLDYEWVYSSCYQVGYENYNSTALFRKYKGLDLVTDTTEFRAISYVTVGQRRNLKILFFIVKLNSNSILISDWLIKSNYPGLPNEKSYDFIIIHRFLSF
jgi:hypothetical protein